MHGLINSEMAEFAPEQYLKAVFNLEEQGNIATTILTLELILFSLQSLFYSTYFVPISNKSYIHQQNTA